MAKRAREQAVKEKREMKRVKRQTSAADRAAERAAAAEPGTYGDAPVNDAAPGSGTPGS
jgi:hypothetical protein